MDDVGEPGWSCWKASKEGQVFPGEKTEGSFGLSPQSPTELLN